jgi:hypothetical protein
MGYDENNVLHGDHYSIDGLTKLTTNARVCTDSDAARFLRLIVDRVKGK